MKRILCKVSMLIALAACTVSCNHISNVVTDKSNEKACSYLRNTIMSTYYYWYKSLPDIKYDNNTDIYEFFDDLLYEKDRWSWMIDGQTFIAEESGIIYGTYGASLGQLHSPSEFERILDYNVMVRYVYPGSPFDKAGIKRGWVLTSLDGRDVLDYWLSSEKNKDEFNALIGTPSITVPHLFTFKDPDGNIVEKSITAAESLNTRPCLVKKVFTSEDYPGLTAPVGYYHYLAFKADDDVNGKSMMDDISEPMEYFKERGVKTLIVDLRYNGGGDSRASDLFVNLVAPRSADGKVYVTRQHNNRLTKLDESNAVAIDKNSPEFKCLYFITGKGSASASEMTLNGLKPLANIQQVGGITYGKPNGMYVFMYPNLAAYKKGDYSGLKYVFLPICFYNCNGDGVYIPDDGMVPDNIRPDDLYHDFGPTEDNIAACLHHIVHGTYPALPELPANAGRSLAGKSVKPLMNEPENDNNYGLFTVKTENF